MSNDAAFHRTFELYTPMQRVTEPNRLGRLPSYFPNMQRHYAELHQSRTSYAAFQLRSDGLRPVRIANRPGQDFRRHATAWERLYSRLCGSPQTDPVVDEKFAVVGHLGWFGPSRIFVQKGIGVIDDDNDGWIDMYRSINETLELYGSVRVALTRPIGKNTVSVINPDPHSGVEYKAATAQTVFHLLIDTGGTVLLELGRRSRDGVAPPDIDPFLLLGAARVVAAVGSGVGRILARRIGAKTTTMGVPGASATGGAGQTLPGMGAAGTRQTLTGMGAVGPGGGAAARTGARMGAGGRPEMTVDEMGNYLASMFRSNPELTRLMQARALGGDTLKKEVDAILKAWERRTGKQVEIVPQGTVTELTGNPGNFASMQGNKLMIERQVLDTPRQYDEEAVHELASAALGGRGVAHIWIAGHPIFNAQVILEAWIGRTGSFDWFRRFIESAGP